MAKRIVGNWGEYSLVKQWFGLACLVLFGCFKKVKHILHGTESQGTIPKKSKKWYRLWYN